MFRTIWNVLTFCALAASVGLTAWFWSTMPDIIPIHFGISGKPDGWGSKLWLVGLPFVALAVTGLLFAVERFAVLSRKPWLSEEKNKKNFELAKKLAPPMRFLTTSLFAYIQWTIIGTAAGWTTGINAIVMIAYVLCILGTAVWAVWQQLRN